jgi:antitoxin (DNA-binding transcriptional repressor) of toxin-antitoxin stability system
MAEVGIRALKQNASAVVAAAAAGETLIVTDRGRAIAQLGPLPRRPLAAMLEHGAARPPRTSLRALPAPIEGLELSQALAELRADERY